MKRIKELVTDHPIVTYYFTTFLISWGGLVLVIGGPGKISSQPAEVPFLPLYLITVAGPFIAGLLLTGLYVGKKGYRDLFSRLFKWRVSGKWYAIALLIAPLTVFTVLFVLSMASPVFRPAIFSAGDNPLASVFGMSGSNTMTILLFILLLGLFNGFVEELGWTGFAVHNMKRDRGLIATGLNLGLMWGLWHLFSNYIGSAKGAGTVPIPLYMTVILFSFLPPFRIIMIWVYDNTKSLFLAILMHASLDVFWILSMPQAINGQQRIIWYVAWAIVLWGIVAVKNYKKYKLSQQGAVSN